MTELVSLTPCVLVCQNRTCLKQGSREVLSQFQQQEIPGWTVAASHCMGQCGSGPIVRVLPDDILYWRVRPDEVKAIVDRHLLGGKPVRGMMKQ